MLTDAGEGFRVAHACSVLTTTSRRRELPLCDQMTVTRRVRKSSRTRDEFARQTHRDMDPPSWAEVVVYENAEDAALGSLEAARDADMIVKTSGIGVFDELLESAVL